ncbi:hypothetical protein CKO15_11880 [Halorhodospira abdelmalekii]|nr:hypothetical protein [Halorhodospira abdelmalekii]
MSYVVGPVTGFMYLAAHRDKPEVRFHACRSILISAVILVAWIAIYVLSFSVLGLPLIFWAGLGFLIYMAVMTIKKQPLEIPLLGEYTKKFADKMAPGGGK